MNRIFYILQSSDKKIQRILDLIRILAEPSEKIKAHITVRGPYKYDMSKNTRDELNKRIKGTEITINGVGHFFDENQNTVYFKLDAPSLKNIWYKPTYKSFNPHITIYDGSSRVFAQGLFNCLSNFNYNIKYKPTELIKLNSVKGQTNFELKSSFDAGYVKEIAGPSINALEIESISEQKRINLIHALVSYSTKYLSDANDVFDFAIY